MKQNKTLKAFAAAVSFAAMCSSASAAVIDSADVAGLKTFQDTLTGRVWLDMNNFFNTSTADMLSVANAAGFTFAAKADLTALLSSLSLSGGEWTSYAAVMGKAPNRDLIWGSYDDGGDANTVGWAWAYSGDTAWNVFDGVDSITGVPNGGSAYADMNVWAYRTGAISAAVPEPASLALLGLGLAGIGALRRKQRA